MKEGREICKIGGEAGMNQRSRLVLTGLTVSCLFGGELSIRQSGKTNEGIGLGGVLTEILVYGSTIHKGFNILVLERHCWYFGRNKYIRIVDPKNSSGYDNH